jgi:hypothetical protein
MSTEQLKSSPFRGHWCDSLITWIRSLPIPSWLFYLLLFLTSGLIFSVISWLNGNSEWGEVQPIYFVSGFWLTGYLGANHFLIASAGTALREFRMSYNFSEEVYQRRQYVFTHIPRWPGNMWSLGGILIGAGVVLYAFNYLSPQFDLPISGGVLVSSVGFLFYFLALYRIYHQMRIVVGLFASIEKIDLYDLGSIYALALFPVRIIFLIILTVWANPFFILFPGSLADPWVRSLFAFLSLFTAVVVIPLRGVSGRLKDEKEALLRENGYQLTSTREELYQRLGAHETSHMEELEKGISALFAYRNSIEAIPTLPWKPETIRWLVTVLFLPLVLSMIQFLLQRFFSG